MKVVWFTAIWWVTTALNKGKFKDMILEANRGNQFGAFAAGIKLKMAVELRRGKIFCLFD